MEWLGIGALLLLFTLAVLGTGALLFARSRARQRPVSVPFPEGASPSDFLFDAFASYATNPDRELVRDVEAFVESLEQNKLVAPAYRRTLELCVDGSDFRLPRRVRGHDGGRPEDEVFDLIRAYMEKSRAFVLFVGPRSSDHPWIQRELAWWIENRGIETVLIAVTHGRDPKSERGRTFPEAVLKEGLDRGIWIDLRGFRTRKGEDIVAPRDYEEERLRLTAALIGPEVSAADLIAGWQRAAARQRRRLRLLRGLAGSVVIAGALILGWAVVQWRDSSREARASGLALVSRQSSGVDANRRLDGLAYAASSLAEEQSPLGSATLIEAARALPKHVRSIVHHDGKKAADIVRFLAEDRLILSAGFTKILQFAAAENGRIVGRIDLSGRARAIALHPDRSLIAVATQGGLDLIAYTPGGADLTPRIIGRATPGARFQAVIFEPGGETLIAGDSEGNLSRYRLADAKASSWQPVQTLPLEDSIGAKVAISGLVLDPIAQRLAVSDIVGQVYCLDFGDWTRRSGFIEHSTEIFSMVSSPDGRLAAAADADGGILLFRLATCEVAGRIAPPVTEDTVGRGLDGALRSMPRSERAFTSIAFSPDGSLLGVASHDRTVRIYTADQGVLTHVLVHPTMARAVAFSSSHSFVATGDNEGRIEIWDIGATVESWRLAGIEAFAVDPGGGWISVWVDEGFLGLLEPGNGRILAQDRPADEAFRGGVRKLVPTPDGVHLAARLWSSTRVFLWTFSSLGRSLRLSLPRSLEHPNQAGHVAIVADLASGPGPTGLITGESHQGRAVRLWDGKAATQSLSFPMKDKVQEVAAGKGIAVAADLSGWVRVVSTTSGKKTLGEIRLPGVPEALAVAPDGRHLLVGFVGREQRGGCLCKIGGDEGPKGTGWPSLFLRQPPEDKDTCAPVQGALRCRRVFLDVNPAHALFSPGGDAVAVGVAGQELDEGSLFLLREQAGWQPELLSSAGLVRALDFTADGALLAAGGHSRSVEVFDLKQVARIAEIPLSNPVLDLRFLPGPERRILTLDGYEVGFLRLWDWRPESLIASACERWPESFVPVRNPALPEPMSRRELCGK